MCGGDGSRLWPFSRRDCPKQFLDLLGCGESMLQLTYDRAASLLPAERILTVTTAAHAGKVESQLPELPAGNILIEPVMRNTAPAVLLVAREVYKRDPEGIMAVLPSDHLVVRQDEFRKVMEQGFRFVREHGEVLCVATVPAGPSTAHRYIQMGAEVPGSPEVYKAGAFTGKPDSEMAGIIFESGEFLTNTGIMIFRAKDMCRLYSHYAPDIWEILGACGEEGAGTSLEQAYSELPSATVDDAILERLPEAYVCRSEIGWSDLGSWNALYEMSPKTREGNVTQNSLVNSRQCEGTLFACREGKLIVAAGLKDFIVADSGNALLICPRGMEAELRGAVKSVKSNYGEKYV